MWVASTLPLSPHARPEHPWGSGSGRKDPICVDLRRCWEIGAADRIMVWNRVLGEIGMLYRAPAICSLPGYDLGSVGAIPPFGNRSVSPGYEGVWQLSAYLILPFSLFSCSAALICPICVYIHRTSRKE